MNLSPSVADNISEVLVKIIAFTQTRHDVLTENISNAHSPDFVPKDLPVDEFSALMNDAISEHMCNQRLVLRDTHRIKFGAQGSFQVKPFADARARKLLEQDPDEYIEEQLNRLLENSLNQKIAAELLRKKEKMVSILG